MNITDKDILDSSTSIINNLITTGLAQKEDVVKLLGDCFKEIKSIVSKQSPENPIPAVPIKKSITPDFLICLEDGKQFKSLKRHLRTSYNLSPDEYREKWSLPHDYPMVAPKYSEERSKLAKKAGLGQPHEGCGTTPSQKSKANGSKRPNGTSTRMVGADRGNNPAPS